MFTVTVTMFENLRLVNLRIIFSPFWRWKLKKFPYSIFARKYLNCLFKHVKFAISMNYTNFLKLEKLSCKKYFKKVIFPVDFFVFFSQYCQKYICKKGYLTEKIYKTWIFMFRSQLTSSNTSLNAVKNNLFGLVSRELVVTVVLM